jgi:hypothetical protein
MEARELLEARMLAAIYGYDQLAEFTEGYEISVEQASMVTPNFIGRMLSPDDVSRLVTWIESETARKRMRTEPDAIFAVPRDFHPSRVNLDRYGGDAEK